MCTQLKLVGIVCYIIIVCPFLLQSAHDVITKNGPNTTIRTHHTAPFQNLLAIGMTADLEYDDLQSSAPHPVKRRQPLLPLGYTRSRTTSKLEPDIVFIEYASDILAEGCQLHNPPPPVKTFEEEYVCIQQKKFVVIVIGLIMSVSCQPTPSPIYELPGTEEVASDDGLSRQGGLLATVGSLIPSLLTPLVGNFGTGLINAITATLMGRELALISPRGLAEPIATGPVRGPAPSRG
ncbi:hypothetical protein J6590_000656 [Homalodisca vitripennis]|nr:hypothetical protein J6590_000656 [Homalodisca vitripennis]